MRGKCADILSEWGGIFLEVDFWRIAVFIPVRRAREIYKLYCERRLAQLVERRGFDILGDVGSSPALPLFIFTKGEYYGRGGIQADN